MRKAGLQVAARTYCEWASLQRGIAARTVGDAEVEDMIRTLGLSSVLRSKKVHTTVADSDVVRALDLVDRDFTSERPDKLWVADFTFVRTWADFIYVAFIVDLLAQRIVA